MYAIATVLIDDGLWPRVLKLKSALRVKESELGNLASISTRLTRRMAVAQRW